MRLSNLPAIYGTPYETKIQIRLSIPSKLMVGSQQKGNGRMKTLSEQN